MWIIRRTTDNKYYHRFPQSLEEGQVVLYTDDRTKAKQYDDEAKSNAILFRNEEWEEV